MVLYSSLGVFDLEININGDRFCLSLNLLLKRSDLIYDKKY